MEFTPYLEGPLMAKKVNLLNDISAAQLKKLLVAKEKIEKLEARQSSLLSDLAKVETEIEKVTASWQKGPKKKVVRKKVTKKSSRKKTTKKKSTKKTVRKAAAKKSKKKAVKKAAKTSKLTLDDVIVKTLGKRKMAFQDLLTAIQKNKQFKSKSKNFQNVLRRTLSTSKRVKRVERGVYKAA